MSLRLTHSAAVALAGLLLFTVPGRAAALKRLQECLMPEARDLVYELKDRKLANVGVLKFRVKIGKQPEAFNLPLCTVMAQSLENALIQANREGKLGIIRQASAVAAARKQKISYRSEAGLKKLFDLDYPLAWGRSTVKADAFVTGLVTISPDLATTTVELQLIDRTKKELAPVRTFSVRTDRTILSDICQSFRVSNRKIRRAGDEPDDLDLEALKDAKNKPPIPQNKPQTPQNKPPRPNAMDPDMDMVQLEIRYNGEVQPVTEHDMKGGGHKKVDTPRQGDKISLVIKNASNVDVGVVVAVNGKNTLHLEAVTQESAAECYRWILKSGDSYTLTGWYDKDNRIFPFTALSDEDSTKEEELDASPYLGAIQMWVFVEAPGDPEPTGVMRKALPAGKDKPQDARQALLKVRDRKPIQRAGLIKAGEAEGTADLKEVTTRGRKLQSSLHVWYYDRKKQGSPTTDE
jgi:hypothetical protein